MFESTLSYSTLKNIASPSKKWTWTLLLPLNWHQKPCTLYPPPHKSQSRREQLSPPPLPQDPTLHYTGGPPATVSWPLLERWMTEQRSRLMQRPRGSLQQLSEIPGCWENDVLKGVWHEIFDLSFFSWISVPLAHKYSNGTVLNFFENTRRYTQINVYHRCQWHRRKAVQRCQRHWQKIYRRCHNTGD